MPNKHFTLPNPALVVAGLALVLSIGGTAVAATIAAPNSVVSSSIQNGQVKSADIGDGKVKNQDLRADAVDTRVVAAGAIGSSELSPVVVITANSALTSDADGVPNGGDHGIAAATAQCPVGTDLLGGGAQWVSNTIFGTGNENVYLQEQFASNGQTAWTVEGVVDFGAQGNIRLQAQAFCLTDAAAT